MRHLVFIFTIVLLNACSQNQSANGSEGQNPPAQVAYVNHPNPTDSLCISDIERAKEDIKRGKIIFTQPLTFGSGTLRYEDELRKLCDEHGLVFDFDLIGCVVFKGQTQGCYGEYMNEVLKEKFGRDFKIQLHARADSLFLVNVTSNNTAVQYWHCDERPRLPDEDKRMTDYIPSLAVSEINIKSNKGQWPFFDVGFVVEKDSTISNFYVRSFLAESEENEKYMDELFSIVVRHLQSTYPTWIPGKIKSVPVRTDNNVRILVHK